MRIPDNFADNVNCSFFNNIKELKEKLDYFLKRPEEIEEFSERGRKWLMKKHTSIERAKKVLEEIKNHAQ